MRHTENSLHVIRDEDTWTYPEATYARLSMYVYQIEIRET